MPFFKNEKECFRLITRVLCDIKPLQHKVNAVYLFSETEYNEYSSFRTAHLLYHQQSVKYIAISSLKAVAGYRGFELWLEKLISLGIPPKTIVGVEAANDFPPSTDAEATGLVRFAKTHDWKTIYITAPPLHQFRAFISTISALKREKIELSVYNYPGFTASWDEDIVHSQGIAKGTRSELLDGELERLNHYFFKGDLVSDEEILSYLKTRDQSH